MRFTERVALITGAASEIGIGRQTALAFAREGAKLVIVDVDEKGLARTRDELRESGTDVLSVVADVADTAAVGRLQKDVADRFGAVDCLISNAGIARVRRFVDLTDAELDRVMAVNFGGAVKLIRVFAKAMLDRGSGSIISISSIAGGPWGWKDHAHYSASKAAIEGLTRALAVEFGPRGVRVNAIAPGVIRTAQSSDPVNSVGEEGLVSIAGMIPLRRVGDPAEVARFILALCSDDASYLTGQTVVYDGGITLGDLG